MLVPLSGEDAVGGLAATGRLLRAVLQRIEGILHPDFAREYKHMSDNRLTVGPMCPRGNGPLIANGPALPNPCRSPSEWGLSPVPACSSPPLSLFSSCCFSLLSASHCCLQALVQVYRREVATTNCVNRSIRRSACPPEKFEQSAWIKPGGPSSSPSLCPPGPACNPQSVQRKGSKEENGTTESTFPPTSQPLALEQKRGPPTGSQSRGTSCTRQMSTPRWAPWGCSTSRSFSADISSIW